MILVPSALRVNGSGRVATPGIWECGHARMTRPLAFEAEWELRFGPDNRFRVFYTLDPERFEVQILAIGVKEGNRLRIGRNEVRL